MDTLLARNGKRLAITTSLMLAPFAYAAAEDTMQGMDHSQMQGMDHSQMQGMDDSMTSMASSPPKACSDSEPYAHPRD